MINRTLILLLTLVGLSSWADVVVVGKLTQEHDSAAGDSYSGAIVLMNSGDGPREMRIYQRDYVYVAGGQKHYGEPGEHPRSNASWLTVAPTRITVAPGLRTEVSYTARVPDDPVLRGTYWSMILVEEVPKDVEEKVEEESEGIRLTVRHVIRYAVQIVTNIGTGVSQLKFRSPRLIKSEAGRRLQVDIENTGEHVLTASVYADFYDEQGQYVGRREGAIVRLYPTTSSRSAFDVNDLETGTYKALVIADAGEDNVFGARYTLRVKD